MCDSIALVLTIILLFLLAILCLQKTVDKNKYSMKYIVSYLDGYSTKLPYMEPFSKVTRKVNSLLYKHIKSRQRWDFKIDKPNIIIFKQYGKNKQVKLRFTDYRIYLSLPSESDAETIIDFLEADTIMSDIKESQNIYYNHVGYFEGKNDRQ